MTDNRHGPAKLLFLLLVVALCWNESIAFSPLHTEVRVHGFRCFRNKLSLSMRDLEKEVVASAKAKLDHKRVTQALDSRNSPEKDPEKAAILAEPWQISMAAAMTASCATYFVTQNEFLSVVSLTGVFFAALGDPIEEEGALGAFSRLLGRATIKTVETSKPRLQRIARAAITDEDEYKPEIGQLQEIDPRLAIYIQHLEDENARLELWKERRMLVDQYLPFYDMYDLQNMARQSGIPFEGTKDQLLMRLVELEIVRLH